MIRKTVKISKDQFQNDAQYEQHCRQQIINDVGIAYAEKNIVVKEFFEYKTISNGFPYYSEKGNLEVDELGNKIILQNKVIEGTLYDR